MRPDFLGSSQRLVVSDGLHPLCAEAVDGRGVLPQIELGADEDDGDVRRMMADLWVPLQLRISLVLYYPFAALASEACGKICAPWP